MAWSLLHRTAMPCFLHRRLNVLHVITPDEVYRTIYDSFSVIDRTESVNLADACGRILSESICSGSDEPPFDRSTVDGYAVRAADTFGSSVPLPAILEVAGEIRMGELSDTALPNDSCIRIPTGGALPAGADCVVMQEHTEDFEDGTIGVTKAAAPGENIIFKGDDIRCGQEILPAGRKLLPQDIGLLASLGFTTVNVRKALTCGIISTGDELVPEDTDPAPGQIRDINSKLLGAVCAVEGCDVRYYGIVKDQLDLLQNTLSEALAQCDIILMSGGSSVGEKDNSVKAVSAFGEILFHGIAVKPGKPTLLGKVSGKPVFGLPGHPQAAFFTAKLFVCAMIDRLSGRKRDVIQVSAILTKAVSSNDGRELYMPVSLIQSATGAGGRQNLPEAVPLHSKSGLISSLSRAQGYICVPRNREGYAAGEIVKVTMF